ncbi:hypothetical protein I6E11_09455 [Bacteroides caecigallinarum]|uniref:hypothetical protein n=1 Tax=Bacteroides caecigallinarum TaxID=1411144 RepID=UPI001F2FAE6C|nr:hypothetical protein [Bacteroides caecigallinarum]MCF2594004.1 hypothetical protein [Bacteroides caecigallinarum]
MDKEKHENFGNKKVFVLEDGEKVLKTMADSLKRKESVLTMINTDWYMEAVNFIKGYLSFNDVSEIDISDYDIRYYYNEDGEIYDYDLFFVGLDNKGDVVVKTSKDNIYFRFSELDDVMRFEIINSIIKDVYGK